MATYNITAVTRRAVYTGSSGTGPYAFNFPILSTSDISVFIDSSKKTLTSDYTVSLSSTTGTGSITFTSTPTTPTSSNTITLVGGRTIQRTSNFSTGGDLLASTLNDELDSLTIFNQQVSEDTDRSIKAPVFDPTSIDMTLPAKATRASKVLAFDSDGDPTVIAPAVSSVSVSTGDAGSSASASYTSSSGALALTIPRGNTGQTGNTGSTGSSGQVSVGSISVSTLSAGQSATATVSNVGSSTNATLNFAFGIPQGSTGSTGSQGPSGEASLADVTSLAIALG